MTSSEPQSAIVLVHGLLGFAKFGFPGMRICYFKGLCDALGEDVFFPKLPGTGSIRDRAEVLARFIDNLPHEEIHIVGHSMGGLDARYLIHHLDPDHRVKRLVSVATPHRGSVIGDWALDGKNIVTRVIRGITRPALDDLTPAFCTNFNAVIPDRKDVDYWSYAGVRPQAGLPFWLKPWGKMLEEQEGANDGMVSLESARWGKFCGQLEANHFEMAGWRVLPLANHGAAKFDHLRFYRDLVAEIRA